MRRINTVILGAALLLGGARNASATLFLQDFFGSFDGTNNPAPLVRLDAAGNVVPMNPGNHGPTLIGIDGLRAQFPNNSIAVWSAPGGQGAATWFFASASTDPFEPPTPGDLNNLILAAGADAGTGGHVAALLPFTPPSGAYTVAADMIPEGGDLRDWVAIGFTSSLATLNSNFESFGQAWLLLRMNATGLGPTTWELHTNGLAGPSLTGTANLTGQYIPMELTYDPVAHLVSGSISGVATGSIPYTAVGIEGVGMEAVEHVSFGIADNFSVRSAADADGDGVPDARDNCTLAANADQRDTDADGYGNICDPDFNGDGTVNINDFNRLKARLNISPVVDIDADLDGNGAVNINDFNRLKSFLGKPPGPSGLHPNCPPTCP
jgi:hypothetical protein